MSSRSANTMPSTVARSSNRNCRAGHHGLAVMVLAALPLLSACSGLPEVVMESDLPTVYGMETRASFDVANPAGNITKGEFLMAGGIADFKECVTLTQDRFLTNGWTAGPSDQTRRTLRATFTKGTRVANMTIMLNSIEPANSTAMILVSEPPPAS